AGGRATMQGRPRDRMSRRAFLRAGAATAATAAAASAGLTSEPASAQAGTLGFTDPGRSELVEVTIAELQARMSSGQVTSRQLVQRYVARIHALDQGGPKVNSVLQINPDAEEIAQSLDDERGKKGPRGPLHGVPIMI